MVFLNHGSFGACPAAVSEYRQKLLKEFDSQPLDFMLRKYMPALPEILRKLEDFAGAQEGSVVLVPNATTGVNTILSNIFFRPGDQVIVTGQEYFASRNALHFHAGGRGADVVEVPITVPVESEDDVIDSVLSRLTDDTVLVMIDHVSSPTGMVFPVERLIGELDGSGVDVLVDGAHGPGMLPLDLKSLDVAYYTGNCHKWLCTPCTSALLYVRPDRQQGFRPAVMSHFHTDFEAEMSPFQMEFSWNGTIDPTPRMTIPFAMDYLSGLHSNGWNGIMEDNHRMAVQVLGMLQDRLELQPACPPSMIGSMGSVILPWRPASALPHPEGIDPLQKRLREEFGIEIPVTFTSIPRGRFLRYSCQLYNTLPQYNYLITALQSCTL